jgi:hypothetical protein
MSPILRRLIAAWPLVFIFFLAAVTARPQAAPQQGSLRGSVTGGTPDGQVFTVDGARLELDGSADGLPSLATFADSNGNYVFAQVAPGTYVLKASSEGFKNGAAKVTIRPGEAVTQDIRLALAQVHQEVEVHETAPQVAQQAAAPPATLSAASIKTVPTTESKYKDALPFVPSVVRAQDEKIYIVGREESEGMLLMDSMESVDPVTGSFVVDVPVDAIDSLEVFKAPFRTEYGGFSGGLTSIHTRAPANRWKYSMNDLNPSIRGRAGHWVGFARAEPRLYFSGPLTKKLTFYEAFRYELRKEPIPGQPWPVNETKRQGFNSFTDFQYMFSQTHLTLVRINVFPRRVQFSNIGALTARPATADIGQRGYSINIADSYQVPSGGLLASQFKLTKVNGYSHGQGSNDMLISPDGLGGNYFNAWNRASHQEEALETFQFPMMEWLGKHELMLGGDVLHRHFDGQSVSHTVRLLREDGSTAEQISFLGPGDLAASDTEYSGFVQDHWAFNQRFAVDVGVRYLGESLGSASNFAPRLGFVFSPDSEGRTVFRGGIGRFDNRVPMLAGDFADNPLRVVSMYDSLGSLAAPPASFVNTCVKRLSLTASQPIPCSNLGTNPYSVTWRLEADQKVGTKVQVKLSYLQSRNLREFILNPLQPIAGNPSLELSNTGLSRYHEYEVNVRYHPGERAYLNLSYVHSRSFGDLNTVNALLVPIEQPVIRPNRTAFLPSDVPDRVTALGRFSLPKDITLIPAFDLHTGFPYSDVDVLQNYVGTPNGRRYPIYFSVDWRIYRDFALPFGIHKGHKFRLGIYSVDTTRRRNPNEVYNNIASPMYGTFTGLTKRINGIVIGFAE